MTEALTPFREKQRCKAILSCPEAQGRENLARHLALETALTVEQAKAVLTSSPKTSSASPRGNGFQWPGLGRYSYDDGGGSKGDQASSLKEIHTKVYGARREDCAKERARRGGPRV